MTSELVILPFLGGALLGLIAWIPLAIILTRVPGAGKPTRVRLSANVADYERAMREAGS